MKRSALAKLIFAELRAAFGPEVATRDLARMATTIVQAYLEEADEFAEFGTARERSSILSMPVDEAIREGWRILAFEEEGLRHLDEADARRTGIIRPLIEKYLGPEWRQQRPTGQF